MCLALARSKVAIRALVVTPFSHVRRRWSSPPAAKQARGRPADMSEKPTTFLPLLSLTAEYLSGCTLVAGDIATSQPPAKKERKPQHDFQPDGEGFHCGVMLQGVRYRGGLLDMGT